MPRSLTKRRSIQTWQCICAVTAGASRTHLCPEREVKHASTHQLALPVNLTTVGIRSRALFNRPYWTSAIG